MKLATTRGVIDLDKIVFLDTYRGAAVANSDGLQIEVRDNVDKLMLQYLFSCPVIDADKIIVLAEAIKEVRKMPESIVMKGSWAEVELATAEELGK